MKNKIIILVLTVLAVISLSSCRGKAAVKTVEAAEKALQKAPKRTTTIKSGALLESGKFADDAVKAVEKIDYEDAGEDEYEDLDEPDPEEDW